MNREEIIAMAREAGILSEIELMPKNQWRQDIIMELERFASAIRTATKEEDARIVEPSADHRANPNDYICGVEGLELLENAAKDIRASK